MKSLIVANWKCNPTTLKEAKGLFDSVKKALLRQRLRTGEGIKNIKNVEVVLCPPFIYLSSFKFQVSSFKLGAQNCFWEEKGAYTGEISPLMIKNLGIEYVIVGHSERRKYFRETDEEINKKIKKALSVGLKIILCVGETTEEKEQGKKQQVLIAQIEKALDRIPRDEMKNISVAYEPVWAIGTGNNCSTDETMKSIISIRQIITRLYNRETADKVRIIYGGSVNGENSGSYLKESLANGLLVGGASLKPEEFIKIVRSAT
ncbi:triose-phosphate isomerase [Patescibacteria group bacterium]|nr:triose-phosphate isomerase [Patescibacteria group bacterium]